MSAAEHEAKFDGERPVGPGSGTRSATGGSTPGSPDSPSGGSHGPGSEAGAGSEAGGRPSQDEAGSFERLLGQLESGAGPQATASGASGVFSQLRPATGRADLSRQPASPPAETIEIPFSSVRAGARGLEQVPGRADQSSRGELTQPPVAGVSTPPADRPGPGGHPAPSSKQSGGSPGEPAVGPGEFTRIFTQLPKPSSAPPAILAGVLPTASPAPEPEASQPGEFTQFFQALASKPVVPASDASRESEADRTGRSAAPGQTPAPSAGIAPRTPEPMPEPKLAPESPPQSSAGGEFTAMFQALGTTGGAPSEPSGVGGKTFAPAGTPHIPAPASVAPSFAAVVPPAGEEPFPVAFANPAPRPSLSGGFTELLQALDSGSSPPGAAARPQVTTPPALEASAFAPTPVAPSLPRQARPAETFGIREAANSPLRASSLEAAQFARKPAPPSAIGAPGEFTQLLQSLKSPAAESKPGGSEPATAAATSAAAAPFAAETPLFTGSSSGTGGPSSAGGASEFTRIIQGSELRSAQPPAPAFAPAPASKGNAAVGMPIAMPAAMPKAPAIPPPASPVDAAKTRLQAMLPFLLAMNAVLLLLLVALVLIFLRPHH